MADREWWRGSVLYQIYPRSYKDTTGNGIGDLKGVIEKLDYVADLGVEGIWLSPFFKSPMVDYGYDVSDYRDVDPLFGTRDDFRILLDKAHKLDLKIIVDMVLNHTSQEHPWFKESRQSRDNKKADWYVWADPKDDGNPPNNWLSIFGGSAWRYDSFRGQYYLHNFLKEQPDLNFHNPQVLDAMLAECRYWLDFGVDGIRLDVINFCTHDKKLRDNPVRKDEGLASQLEFRDVYAMQWHKYDKTQPENMTFIRRLRALMDEYPNRMGLAEVGDDFSTRVAAEYTASPRELHTAYSFALMTNKGNVPEASVFRAKLQEQAAESGDSWPTWAISNHDVVRAASRWSGTDYGHDPRLSKMLMALLGSLRGTAFIYQGEELGLPEADIPVERILDPWGKYLYPKWKGRDGCRTPMPWTMDAPSAGFSTNPDPWLPIPADHRALSVAAQEHDLGSTLSFVKKFIAWRREQPVLRTGSIVFTDSGRDDVLSFDRILGVETVHCLFNLSLLAVDFPAGRLAPYEARFSVGNTLLLSSAST